MWNNYDFARLLSYWWEYLWNGAKGFKDERILEVNPYEKHRRGAGQKWGSDSSLSSQYVWFWWMTRLDLRPSPRCGIIYTTSSWKLSGNLSFSGPSLLFHCNLLLLVSWTTKWNKWKLKTGRQFQKFQIIQPKPLQFRCLSYLMDILGLTFQLLSPLNSK